MKLLSSSGSCVSTLEGLRTVTNCAEIEGGLGWWWNRAGGICLQRDSNNRGSITWHGTLSKCAGFLSCVHLVKIPPKREELMLQFYFFTASCDVCRQFTAATTFVMHKSGHRVLDTSVCTL